MNSSVHVISLSLFCVKEMDFWVLWTGYSENWNTVNSASDSSVEGGGVCLYYESDICSAGQDIPRHLLTITIRYRVQNVLLLNCIMNQKTSAPVLSSYMSKTYFKIFFPPTTSSSRLELPWNFPEIYSHVPTSAISHQPHRPWFDSLHCLTKNEKFVAHIY